jgi:alcohol dehydrogenase class IV
MKKQHKSMKKIVHGTTEFLKEEADTIIVLGGGSAIEAAKKYANIALMLHLPC